MKLKQEILIQVKQTIATKKQQVVINCCSITNITIDCYYSRQYLPKLFVSPKKESQHTDITIIFLKFTQGSYIIILQNKQVAISYCYTIMGNSN